MVAARLLRDDSDVEPPCQPPLGSSVHRPKWGTPSRSLWRTAAVDSKGGFFAAKVKVVVALLYGGDLYLRGGDIAVRPEYRPRPQCLACMFNVISCIWLR